MNKKEIIFRAWAIASRKMFNPDTEDGWELQNGVLSPIPNTILMQYTGLKDKNGKEIYEGDIIEWTDFYGKKHTASVSWWQVGAKFDLSEDGTLDIKVIINRHGIKIIGNIYENSELIN